MKMNPFDAAWTLLKQVTFEDVAPLPEQIRGSPSQLPDKVNPYHPQYRKPPYTRDVNISEEEFRNRFIGPGTGEYTHGSFDEGYMFDQLYPALEAAAIHQAGALGPRPSESELRELGYFPPAEHAEKRAAPFNAATRMYLQGSQ